MLACAPLSPSSSTKTHFRADDQAVEGPVENGVAMKIDFTAVRRFDEIHNPRQRGILSHGRVYPPHVL